MGYACILDGVGTSRDNRRYRNTGGPYVLLLRICVPRSCRYSRMEGKENIRATEDIALDMWDISGTDSFASRLGLRTTLVEPTLDCKDDGYKISLACGPV